MQNGTVFSRSNVTIDGQLIKGVRAVIAKGIGHLLESDGTEIKTMTPPIDITDYFDNGATWSNGTDTWVIREADCNCHPQ